jgi:hypothetical protein
VLEATHPRTTHSPTSQSTVFSILFSSSGLSSRIILGLQRCLLWFRGALPVHSTVTVKVVPHFEKVRTLVFSFFSLLEEATQACPTLLRARVCRRIRTTLFSIFSTFAQQFRSELVDYHLSLQPTRLFSVPRFLPFRWALNHGPVTASLSPTWWY